MGVLVTQSLLLKASEALATKSWSGARWPAIGGGARCCTGATRGSLLAMTTRLLANRGDAEEVVQDTFVTAFEQLGTLREPGAVRGWLGQIAVNLVAPSVPARAADALPRPRSRRRRRHAGGAGGSRACPPSSAPSWRWSIARCAE